MVSPNMQMEKLYRSRYKAPTNALMTMDDKEQFDNTFIENIIKRVTLCGRNENKKVVEAERLLSWMIAVRK